MSAHKDEKRRKPVKIPVKRRYPGMTGISISCIVSAEHDLSLLPGEGVYLSLVYHESPVFLTSVQGERATADSERHPLRPTLLTRRTISVRIADVKVYP